MKLRYKTLLAVLVIFAVSSCQDKLDEINVDPDTFPRATDAQVLSSAEAYIGVFLDVDLNQASFLWAQYYTWGIGVAIGNPERFVSEPDDFNGYWARAYSNTLADLKYLRTKSENYGYTGVAKILEAYTYQGLVDHFGDIPYSEALMGDERVFSPNYDDASEVYDALIEKLDDALNDFELAADQIPSQREIDLEDGIEKFVGMRANDYIYGGDVEKWIRFANSLKLRILLRTSDVNPKQAEIEALTTSGTLFIETEDQMPQVPFNNVAGSQNPMWAIMEAGVGDFYFASNATLNVLNDLGDPRAEAFYDVATSGPSVGSLRGIDQGTIDSEPFTNPSSDYSGSSNIAVSPSNSVIFMSPWEVWFLRAEAAARYGTDDDEETAFNNAVQANFDFLGVAGGSAYITSLNYNPGAPLIDRINMIAIQKWISMNGTQEDEGWIETRRFDRDGNRIFTEDIFQNPPQSVLSGRYPSVWLIPASERSLNSNSPSQRVLTDRVFWDLD